MCAFQFLPNSLFSCIIVVSSRIYQIVMGTISKPSWSGFWVRLIDALRADGSSFKICEAEEDFRKFEVRQKLLLVCVLADTLFFSFFVNAVFVGRHFPSRLKCFLGWPGDNILSWQVKADFQLLTTVWPVFSMHCVRLEGLVFCTEFGLGFKAFSISVIHKILNDPVVTCSTGENWGTLMFIQGIKCQWGYSNFATWILLGNRRQDVLYHLTLRSKRNVVAHACLS